MDFFNANIEIGVVFDVIDEALILRLQNCRAKWNRNKSMQIYNVEFTEEDLLQIVLFSTP